MVTLTNGGQFLFLNGYVNQFRSPRSYYCLQDPDRIPEFYGPINVNKKEAIQIARDTLKKIGYAPYLPINQEPEVEMPVQVGTNYVARYRVNWGMSRKMPFSDWRKGLIQVEVNASNRRVHFLTVITRDIPSADIKIDPSLVPTNKVGKTGFAMSGWAGVVATNQEGKPLTVAVSKPAPLIKGALEDAIIQTILPKISEFAKTLNIAIPQPLTTNDIDKEKGGCWTNGWGNLSANVRLKQGDRFVYSHGYVSAYWAPDSLDLADEPKDYHKIVGKINLSEKEAVRIARDALKKLGWDKALRTDLEPSIATPREVWRFTLERGSEGTNLVARFNISWKPPEERGTGLVDSCVEIDATTKVIKSIFANVPKLWRPDPKIDVPHTNAP